jgi:hypothetical protein
MLRLLPVSVVLVAGTVSPAYAQASRPAVNILIEKIDEDGAACGVTEQALYGAASSALRYNRIREGVSTLNNLTLYINVNTQRSGGMCAMNLNVELYQNQTVNVRAIGEVWGKAQFCDKGALGIGRAGTVLTATAKDLIDSCLSNVPPLVLRAVS